MKFWKMLSIAVTLVALGLGGMALNHDEAQAADAERPSVSDFTLKNLDGKKVKLSDYKGKVVVVSFWATWCKPCMQELGHLQKFQDELGEKGLVILAISTDGPETLSDVRSTVRRKRWKMPILLDHDGKILAQHNPRGTQPFSLFVDRKGGMAEKHEGFATGDQEKYLTIIEKLLAEKP